MTLGNLLRSLGHQHAAANARAASREASRHRVEREQVEIYLERLHTSRRTERAVAPGPAAGRPAAELVAASIHADHDDWHCSFTQARKRRVSGE